MNKIKRINISDFRIYEGTQEFNLEKDGSSANLVVLYAPNGYGKTSFYDAIEWSYSDKIERINKEADLDSRKNDYTLDDNVILTNRNSYKKGKQGVVSIQTDDFELSKRVHKWGTRDYRKGELLKGNNAEKLHQLTKTNILSQDLIDSFLRHTTPEKKFEQLEKFASQVEADLKKFKQVDNTYTLLLRRINELKEKIKEKESDIDKIKVNKSALRSVNELISVVNKIEEVNLQLSPLSQDISAKELEQLGENLTIITSSIKNQIEQLEKTIQIAKELHKSFHEFQAAVENEIKCNKEIASLNEIKKLYTDKNALSEVLEKKNKTFNDLNILLIKHKRLFDSSKDADVIHKRIKNEKEVLDKHYEKQLKAKALIARLNQRILEIEQEKERQSKIVDKYQIYLKDRDQQAIEEQEYDKHISINEKKIAEIDGIITPLIEELEKLRGQKDLHNDILENKKWNDFKIFANEEYTLKLDLYTQFQTEKRELIEQYSSKDKELKASGSLQENLERIKHWGAEFVSHTNKSTSKTNTCPLCNTPFDTFELLLEAIEKDRVDVLDIEKLRSGLKEIDKKRLEVQDKLSELELFFQSSIEKTKQGVVESIATKNRELENHKKLRSDHVLEIKTAKGKKDLLKEKISIAIAQLNIPKQIRAEDYLQYIQDQIENYEKKKAKLTGNIASYASFVDSINSNLASGKVAYNEKLTVIDKLEKNVGYEEFVALLNECNLKHNDVVSEDFKSEYIDKIEKQFQESARAISDYKGKIRELVEKIEKHECKVSEELIPGKLIEEETCRKTLQETVEAFRTKFKLIYLSEVKTIEQINELIEIKGKRKDALKDTMDNILSIQSKTEIVREQIDKQVLEKELKSLEEEEEKYITAYEKLGVTRKSCIDHIQKGIETTFNKKVINEIYQRIEPHPSLDEIYFRAEIGDNGKPRLVITTKGGDDELNPNIFLSAGQVNVLSLSIFLAKAYEYGSEIISTIFMDDPIQNLSDINILSFIDVLRTLTQDHDKQIVISTHDEKFFRLLQNKMPEEYCNSKFLEFEAPGVLKQ